MKKRTGFALKPSPNVKGRAVAKRPDDRRLKKARARKRWAVTVARSLNVELSPAQRTLLARAAVLREDIGEMDEMLMNGTTEPSAWEVKRERRSATSALARLLAQIGAR